MASDFSELAFVQLGVEAAGGEQGVVRALFDYIAVAHHQYQIGVPDRRQTVRDYKAGKDRAIKYLMGQVMKESKGTLNPSMAMNILKEELNK